MSRHVNRGRQTQLAVPRGTKSKGVSIPRGKVTKKKITLTTKKNKRNVNISDIDSTSSDNDSDDFDEEESDDADDESDEPDVLAPSHRAQSRVSEAGPMFDQLDDALPVLGESSGFDDFLPESWEMFSPGKAEVDGNVFESDDDEVLYNQVNDISDSDGEVDEAQEEKAILEESDLEFEEDPAHFLNQIDGMSQYGFGSGSDDDDDLYHSPSEGDLHDVIGKRVHFAAEQQSWAVPAASLLDSPPLTRSLLPSAMADGADMHTFGTDNDALQSESDDDYDTDATEELDAPAEKWKAHSTRRPSRGAESTPPALVSRRSSGDRKGPPPRGIFVDDGDKATAILDPSGKRLIITDPHLLGKEFARRYGQSAPASPSHDFEDAVFGETDSSQTAGTPRRRSAVSENDIDATLQATMHGNAGLQNVDSGDHLNASVDDLFNFKAACNNFEVEGSDEEDPEAKISLDALLSFDEADNVLDYDLPEDNLLTHMSNQPTYQPSTYSEPSTPIVSHLRKLHDMNVPVTAFRNHADPSNHTHIAQLNSPIRNLQFSTPAKQKRKRNQRTDSPYNHVHYSGVTPVQRVTLDQEAERIQSSSPLPNDFLSRSHKRRRTMF